MSEVAAEVFIDYGPAIPLDSRCRDCYADSVILKSTYRLSWSNWESGVACVGGKIECTNCGRKIVSYWG